MSLISDAIDLLIPSSCIICGKRLANRIICFSCIPKVQIPQFYCRKCQTPIHNADSVCDACIVFPPLFTQLRFIWEYHNENVSNFINCFKYRPSLALCKIAGTTLACHISNLFEHTNWDLIVPIPSSKQSINERLFNQCSVIAIEIQRKLKMNGTHMRICHKSLMHRGYGKVQASLSHSLRLKNVRSAFLTEDIRLEGKRILLVEDVVTTGATLNAACKKILKAGALSVDVIALARSQSWNDHRHAV